MDRCVILSISLRDRQISREITVQPNALLSIDRSGFSYPSNSMPECILPDKQKKHQSAVAVALFFAHPGYTAPNAGSIG